MLDTLRTLPKDPAKLRVVSELLMAEDLQGQLAACRKARFGTKSARPCRKIPRSKPPPRRKKTRQRRMRALRRRDPQAAAQSRPAARSHLDREDQVLSPGETCSNCGGAIKQLGEDVTEELEYVPGHFAVKRIVRPRLTCTCCEAFAQAEPFSRPITRGRAGLGLPAHVLIGKYCDHLPLYRQSEIYARDKVDLHRSTLTDWVGRSTALLAPLAEHIGKLVRAAPALFADDTPVKMQTRGKSGRSQTAWLWSYVRDERP